MEEKKHADFFFFISRFHFKIWDIFNTNAYSVITPLPYFQVYIFLKLRNCAQGTLLNVMWQLGWEGSLGENGYMYLYG